MSVLAYPSVDGWITPRTDGTRLTTENCLLLLPKKIEQVTRILLKADTPTIGIVVTLSGGQVTRVVPLSELSFDGVNTLAYLDITRFVVTKDIYALLDTVQTKVNPETTLLRNNTWYYESGDDKIILVNDEYTRTGSGSNWTTSYLIGDALYYNATSGGTTPLTLYWHGASGVVNVDYIVESQSTLYHHTDNPLNLSFRIYYEPQGESVKLEVPKTTPSENDFVMPYSQTQPIVTSSAFGKNMTLLANRLGVETRTICRKCSTLAQIRKVGTIWRETTADGVKTGNIWRLVNNQQIYKCGYCYSTETWAKNYFSQSEFVGVNRQFRSWNIPAETVQRNVLYQDYCYLTTDGNFPSDSVALSLGAKQEILRALDTTWRNDNGRVIWTEGNCMWLWRGTTGSNGVVLSSNAFGFGNSLVFGARTKDNLSAGTQRNVDDDGQYCQDVFYTKTDGTLDKCRLFIAPTIAYEDTDKYPEVTASDNVPNYEFTVFDSSLTLDLRKEPAEQINPIYQVHICTNDVDLVVGNGWAQNCPLVVQRYGTTALKYWTVTERLPNTAQTMSTTWGTETQTSPVAFNYNALTVTIQAHSCLTDTNNNIIFANNSDSAKVVYLKFTHSARRLGLESGRIVAQKYRDGIV